MAFLSAAGTRGTTGHSIQSKQVLGLRDETPAQGPQFSLGGRTKDLWKSGLPRPYGQRNSVLREEFRGLIVARTFLLSRSCEGGQSKIVLFLYKDNRRSQRLGATLFLSSSSFFMISCRGEQKKEGHLSGKRRTCNGRDY